MFKFVATIMICLFAGAAPGFAAQNTSTSPSGASNYSCDSDSGTCHCDGASLGGSDCRDMLNGDQCQANDRVGTPWTGESDARGGGFAWFDYLTCNQTTGQCTCSMVSVRTTPGGTSNFDEADATFGRQTAVATETETEATVFLEVFERPVTPLEDEQLLDSGLHGADTESRRRSGLEEVPDGTSNTLVMTEMVMMNSESEAEERPNEVVSARRGTPRRDHRPETATDPSENAPEHPGLEAPSHLRAWDIATTTLELRWQDNSTREFGVEVWRVDPIAARRDPDNHNWAFIGLFEERQQSRVTGIGQRSDEDFDLTPGTNYCYRMRAYSGFDRAEVSDYSEVFCTETTP